MRAKSIIASVTLAAAVAALLPVSTAFADSSPRPDRRPAVTSIPVTGTYSWTILFAGGGGQFGATMTLGAGGVGTVYAAPSTCSLRWAVSVKTIAITTASCAGTVATLIGKVNAKGICSQARPCQAAWYGSNGQGGTAESVATWYAVRA